MKRIAQHFLVFILLSVLVVLPQNKAAADIYGYGLRISAKNLGMEVPSNGTVPQTDAIAGNVEIDISVYDPRNSTSPINVSVWDVKISSFDSRGNPISSGAGLCSLINITKDNGSYKARAVVSDKESLQGYYCLIEARATVQTAGGVQQTNWATIKTVISDQLPSTSALTSPVSSVDNTSFLSGVSKGISTALAWVRMNTGYTLITIFLFIVLVILIIVLSRRAKDREKQPSQKNFPPS